MASINYDTVVPWDSTLADVGYADADNPDLAGLVINGLKITSGAPTATAGKFLPGAVITNIVTGIIYQNTGTTAAPSWTAMDSDAAVTEKITISSAEILALNATPKTLVAAPGAGKIVVPIFAVGRMTFATAAYATNVTLRIKYAAGADLLFSNATLLAVTAGTVYQPFYPVAAASVTGNDTEYVPNAALVADVATGDPTAGAGVLDIYLTYAIVTV